MNCHDIDHRLEAYLDGELGDAVAVLVAGHLSTCARCAGKLDHARALSGCIRRAMAPEPMPAHERRALRQTIETPDSPPSNGRGRGRARRFAIPALAAALMGVTLLALVGSPLTPPARSERYVYHINNSDTAAAALQNIQFHLRASPKAKFVVVTHNEGVDFLLRDARDRAGRTFEPKIRELAGQGVQFRVCMNTLRVRNIPTARVLAEAQFVPSGIAEVGRLQVEEGFAYLKP
jgi:intracellular sulfur oxidation DsrE/DsrF family protein